MAAARKPRARWLIAVGEREIEAMLGPHLDVPRFRLREVEEGFRASLGDAAVRLMQGWLDRIGGTSNLACAAKLAPHEQQAAEKMRAQHNTRLAPALGNDGFDRSSYGLPSRRTRGDTSVIHAMRRKGILARARDRSDRHIASRELVLQREKATACGTLARASSLVTWAT